MHYLLTFVILMTVGLSQNANAATPLDGLWLTENERSVIQVKECDQGLCGNIYWIIKGGMQTDAKNPDESKRETPMCGLPILWGFTKDSATEWEGGKIYKADDGDVYSAEMELLSQDKLKVRGYVGFSFLGKSQEWTRVDSKDYEQCK